MKLNLYLKSILNGILGISAEILLTSAFIVTGFLVCFLWWAIFRWY